MCRYSIFKNLINKELAKLDVQEPIRGSYLWWNRSAHYGAVAPAAAEAVNNALALIT